MAIKIEKQPNGLYTIRVWARNKDVFGKRKTKQKSNIRTIAVAEREARIIEDQLSADDYQEEITFGRAHNLYLETRGEKISPTTLFSLKSFEDKILKFLGNVKLKDINTRIVQQFINKMEKTVSPRTGKTLRRATIENYVAHIQAVLNWCVANDYLEHNRVKRLEYQEDEEPFVATVLEPEVIGDILAFLKQRYYNLYIPVLLASNMGPRRGEVLGIKKDAIDFERDTVEIKNNRVQFGNTIVDKAKLKTSSSRRKLSFSEFVKQELLEHLEMNKHLDSEYICANVFNGLPTPDYVTDMFPEVVKNHFGIDVRLHDLRHSFNQIGYEEGIDLQDRSNTLGHSNTRTTKNTYTQFSLKKSKDAMNIISNRIKAGFQSN